MTIRSRRFAIALAACAAFIAWPAGGSPIVGTSFFGDALEGAQAQTGSQIRVKPKRVRAGNKVKVYGWAPGCPDAVLLISRAFRRGALEHAGVPAIKANILHTDGYFEVDTRIPPKRKARRYHISGRCGGGNVGVVDLRVLKRL